MVKVSGQVDLILSSALICCVVAKHEQAGTQNLSSSLVSKLILFFSSKTTMAPSASKQKRLAEKAAKKGAKGDSAMSDTPTGSVNGGSSIGPSSTNTPLTSVSAANSTDDIPATVAMARLNLATDRSASGVLVSDVKSRDIKIDAYTLSFHGRLLVEGAEISLNFGQRYGLLGENGSGKVCFYDKSESNCSPHFHPSRPSSNPWLNATSKFHHISTFTWSQERLNHPTSMPSISLSPLQKRKLLNSRHISKH